MIHKCKTHKTYKALREPRANCNDCWQRWYEARDQREILGNKLIKLLETAELYRIPNSRLSANDIVNRRNLCLSVETDRKIVDIIKRYRAKF